MLSNFATIIPNLNSAKPIIIPITKSRIRDNSNQRNKNFKRAITMIKDDTINAYGGKVVSKRSRSAMRNLNTTMNNYTVFD